MKLDAFLSPQNEALNDAVYTFLENELSVPAIRRTRLPSDKAEFFKHYKQSLPPTYSDSKAFESIEKLYFVGAIQQSLFEHSLFGNGEKTENIIQQLEADKKYDSILIFAVNIDPQDHKLPSRSMLAEITRWLNRISEKLPVIVFFRYDKYLSIASTERTKYVRKEYTGEKIGKVALLRDINIENPHRGHLDILEGLQIDRKRITNFEQLYLQWSEVFNISTLNKKFYQELSNWYFWARTEADFYKNKVSKESKYDNVTDAEFTAVNLIRLITRTLFSYFLKEKGLVPQTFFAGDSVRDLLKSFQDDENTYYKAILSNVFFASLNQELSDRRWHNAIKGSTNNPDHQSDYYRYKDFFNNEDHALQLFNQIPFLNGGLFDKLPEDWFSANSPDIPKLPNKLFFTKEAKADISEFFDDKDKAKKSVSVSGLINILNRYKFTIEENTPLEQDIALDPELLGRVFENLLASYNPETKTTARKTSGSFYTPREVVDYMVDESLIAYFQGILGDDYTEKLRLILSADDAPVDLNEDEKQKLIHAIDQCKIIDPACGSGAFPMGILNKMVHVLHKIDPNNEIWKKALLNHITDTQARNAFAESLKGKSFDYTRKLGLIRNCIYGVDIQPIAVQISKLRCFISLIVDQQPDENQANFGIQTLPNLESKFVAANTLIGVPKAKNLFEGEKTPLNNCLLEIGNINELLFDQNNKQEKNKLKKQLKAKREELKTILQGYPELTDKAELIAGFDPYDQNATAPFFDPEWMFGINTETTVSEQKIEGWNDKCFYHVTWHTHNSVRLPDYDPSDEMYKDPVILSDEEQETITYAIFEKAEREGWAILAYNILPNHVHIILAANNETELQKIVQGLKGYSAHRTNSLKEAPRTKVRGLNTVGGRRTLWAKSFGTSFLNDPQKSKNAFDYVAKNREKDGLPPLVPRLQSWVNARLTPTHGKIKVEKSSGFNIVIGNPPYGAKLSESEIEYFKKNYHLKTSETAILFIEKGKSISQKSGILTYIIPKSFSFASNYDATRKFTVDDLSFMVDCGKAFEEVKLEACIVGLVFNKNKHKYKSLKFTSDSRFDLISEIDKNIADKFGFFPNGITQKEINVGLAVVKDKLMLNDIAHNSRGEMLQKFITDNGEFPVIGGKEIDRYGIRGIKGYLNDESLISNKAIIKDNALLVQNIIAHITKPEEHIKITSCIPIKKYVIIDTLNQLIIKNDAIECKEIWGILNSTLINWYVYNFIFGKAIRTMHFDNAVTSRIPIPQANKETQGPFISLADQILTLKRSDAEADISALEAEIDARVFRLYDLTAEEMEVVLSASPCSDAQKERIQENYHRL